MAAGQACEQPARRERHVAGLRGPGGEAGGRRELFRELHAVVGTEPLAEPRGRIAVGEASQDLAERCVGGLVSAGPAVRDDGRRPSS